MTQQNTQFQYMSTPPRKNNCQFCTLFTSSEHLSYISKILCSYFQRSKDTVVSTAEDLHDLAGSIKPFQHPLQPLRYLSLYLGWLDPIQQVDLVRTKHWEYYQYETFHGYDSIHAKVGQCKAVLEKHLWEKDIQNLCLLETLEKQTKSVDKAFFQVAIVPVVFRGALNMMHHWRLKNRR